MGQTQCRVIVDGETIEDILSFDYSSDVMALAETASFTVDNKGGKWNDTLKLGQPVEFILQNPAVNGSLPTTRHRGVVVTRTPRITPTDGNTISIVSGDKGWHLVNSNVPIWVNLQNKTFADICSPTTSPLFDPAWGFTGLVFDGNARRRLKMGVAVAAQAAQRVLDPVWRVQSEPGSSAGDLISEYAKRVGLLVNVSPDGKMCVFRPNDTAPPIYTFRCRDGDPLNNLLEAEVVESATSRWTEVVCVGEQFGYEGPNDPNNPNSTKKRGKVSHPGALPFVHRKCFADGEMFLNGLAQRRAEWEYQRGRWESFYLTVTVAEHYQGNLWLEADNVADVDIDAFGLQGRFYVQSVKCSGSKQNADVTQLVLRWPGTLSATLGEIPNPPIYRGGSGSGSATAAP